MSLEILHGPQGSFELARYPFHHKDPLRAWDAADEYLLDYLEQQQLLAKRPSLLLYNDSFGALATALHDYQPCAHSDSYLSQQATLENYRRNQLDPAQLKLHNSLASPAAPAELVLIKIPKTLALLEDQLHRLRPILSAHSRIVAAGMAKHIHRSTLSLFERLIGPTQTSLAHKKARLIFCQWQAAGDILPSPYPQRYVLDHPALPQGSLELSNHANVFSREKLDIGTRFFLDHLPGKESFDHVLDLGCGNGLLGIVAAHRYKPARVSFVDESYMALASARENFNKAFGTDEHAHFQVGDCLQDVAPQSVDLILNNPPFHQGNVVGEHIAVRMFTQAKEALARHGQLWVVANRHLPYRQVLQRLFGNCKLAAANNKFVVLQALKR